MEEKTQILLSCLFCFSKQFILPEENYKPQSGELIECANCGHMNDYDSLMRIAQRKEKEWCEKQAQKLMGNFNKRIKQLFK